MDDWRGKCDIINYFSYFSVSGWFIFYVQQSWVVKARNMSSVISSAAPRRLHQLLGLASTSHNITSSWSSWKLADRCFLIITSSWISIFPRTCSKKERHYLWATLKKGWQTVIYLEKDITPVWIFRSNIPFAVSYFG